VIALIAGTGALPGLLLSRLRASGEAVLVCALEDAPPDLPRPPDLTFCVETFGGLLGRLAERGAGRVCLAGGIRRPETLDRAALDAATAALAPRLAAAMARGDDGALRIVLSLIEEAGLDVVAPQQIVPDLLPPPGCAAGAVTDALRAEAEAGARQVARMGAADSGQACVIHGGRLLAEEGPEGTDAMLAALAAAPPERAKGGILFKAPKPGQERRADLPVIGPGTAAAAARAGLGAIVIEAGGVMVLDRARVIALCEAEGLTLWVRAA